MASDPVCGMQVNEQARKPRSDFARKKYTFCCAGCKSKFDANPAAYLNRPSAADNKPPAHAHPPPDPASR